MDFIPFRRSDKSIFSILTPLSVRLQFAALKWQVLQVQVLPQLGI